MQQQTHRPCAAIRIAVRVSMRDVDGQGCITICNAMTHTTAQQNDALRCAALRCVVLQCDLESWIVTESRLHVTF